MSVFTIYHTCASFADVDYARNETKNDPSIRHGFGWIPEKVCYFDEPYFLDNGAFREHVTDEWWDYEGYFDLLNKVDRKAPRDPDFVVLPDCYGCAEETDWRIGEFGPWVEMFGWPTYYAIQPDYEDQTELYEKAVVRFEPDGLFIGGPTKFKFGIAREMRELADDYGLAVHIGNPGPAISFCRDVGADSVDTSSVVRNSDWGRLRRMVAANNNTEQTEVAGWG